MRVGTCLVPFEQRLWISLISHLSRPFRASFQKVDLLAARSAQPQCQLRPNYVESDRYLFRSLQPLLPISKCLLQ